MTSRLSSEVLNQLTPLLGSLARLVARGSQVSEAQLHTLLLGADLDSEPAALEELKRWGRLLTALREQPSEDNRHATVEALMLRGLPEAPVLLAVDTVAGRGGVMPPPDRRLTASVERLDFGELRSGQAASAEFEVQGGPGQVVVDSDQVRVTPQQFGAEPTRLRVEVKPLGAGSVLWTTLRLVTAGETLELPVVAQWTEAPQPPPLPPSWVVGVPFPSIEPAVSIPRGAVVVAPDGSGDFRSLEEAVPKAQPGATLYLKAGTHRLAHPLTLDKPLTLIGEGMETTQIVCDGEEHVVKFSGDGLFNASDIAFVHEGTRWARVVEVATGEISLTRCRFTGGVWDEAEKRGGSGLRLLGQTHGTVMECQFIGNGLHGILVEEQAQPTLEGNTCRENKDTGIAYFGSAAGVARQNTCSGNEKNGIYVDQQAQPTLEGNTCRENKASGIGYFGSAAGVARQNTCAGNESHGIYVGGQAQPTLEGNTCRENTWKGIGVNDQAKPTMVGNTCERNKSDGIGFWGSATGVARGNKCEGNEGNGILVMGQAKPMLDENECGQWEFHLSYNLLDSLSSIPTNALDTDFLLRRGWGPSRMPITMGEANKKNGIAFYEQSGGEAQNNRCIGNDGDGIYVASTARPTLKNNYCAGNKGKEVNDQRRS